MASGRSSILGVVSTLAVLLMVCGAGACAKSRKRVLSEPDTEVKELDGGSGFEGPFEPEPDDSEQPPVTVPDEPPRDIMVPMGGTGGRGEPDDPPPPPDPPVPPIVMGPPPVIVHERAAGAAVLDIDPDEPRSWLDRILCEKMLDCDLGGLELLTQEECEALFGGSCASYPQVPEEAVDPDCIGAVEDARCDDLPLALMTPACIESMARVMATIAGTTELRVEGETCGSTTLCDTGLTCLDWSGSCGVCRPYGQIGDDCTDGVCVGGYCDPDTLLCAPYTPAGEPCDRWGSCLPGCAPDGRCVGFFGSTQASPFYTGCQVDSICGGGECRDGYCLPPAPLGASCQRDRQCAFGRCHEGVCAVSASCELPGEGEYCTRLRMCRAPFACQSGRCMSVGTDEPIAYGEYCTHPAQCATGYCQDGLCSLRPGGSLCTSGEDCASGKCVYGLCAPELVPLCGEPL